MRLALEQFDQMAVPLFDTEDLAAGSFRGTDRQGNAIRFPLTSLSVGAVVIDPGTLRSAKEVSERAVEAKKQAKKMAGSSLFIERRRGLS